MENPENSRNPAKGRPPKGKRSPRGGTDSVREDSWVGSAKKKKKKEGILVRLL